MVLYGNHLLAFGPDCYLDSDTFKQLEMVTFCYLLVSFDGAIDCAKREKEKMNKYSRLIELSKAIIADDDHEIVIRMDFIDLAPKEILELVADFELYCFQFGHTLDEALELLE